MTRVLGGTRANRLTKNSGFPAAAGMSRSPVEAFSLEAGTSPAGAVRIAKPRNPRHFDGVKGGRERVKQFQTLH